MSKYCSFFFIFLAGCAFMTIPVSINYQSTQKASLKPSTSISFGQFVDKRNSINSKMVAHLQDQFGPTTGGFEAEKPIVEIIKDGMHQVFSNSNIEITENGTKKIEVDLIDYTTEHFIGFLADTFKNKIMIKLRVINISNDEIVYKETYIGCGSGEGYEFPKKLISSALDNLIAEIFSDNNFLRSIQ